MVKLISFNINGLRARPHQLNAIIEKHQPDVIGLQESKVSNEDFPVGMIEETGYIPNHHGQKGHYGVTLLSKQAPVTVEYGYPWDKPDAQRRLVIGHYDFDGNKLTVINGYFPQGESRKHETKFPAKEKFYADLQKYVEQHCSPDQAVAIMGDFNISPADNDIGIGDKNAKRWLQTGKCSFLPEEREWYDRLKAWGLQDTYRHYHPESNDLFSWFDYRSKGFDDDPRRGLRIDHILATAPLIERCTEVGIDYEIRGMEKPSDHCPIWASFEL